MLWSYMTALLLTAPCLCIKMERQRVATLHGHRTIADLAMQGQALRAVLDHLDTPSAVQAHDMLYSTMTML